MKYSVKEVNIYRECLEHLKLLKYALKRAQESCNYILAKELLTPLIKDSILMSSRCSTQDSLSKDEWETLHKLAKDLGVLREKDIVKILSLSLFDLKD